MYSAGTTLTVDFGVYTHYGIADGNGYVIHNSKLHGVVVKEPLSKFADGKEVSISGIKGEIPTAAVAAAMKYIGMPYNLFSSNCEHFVRLCHRLDIESPQLLKYFLAVGGIGLAATSENPTIQLVGISASVAAALSPRDKNPLPYIAATAVLALGIGYLVA